MRRDDLMRKALWASVAFNAGGALLFAFPGSFGRLAGLPLEAPLVYRALLVVFILLFAGAYAWLATQSRIDRPLVGLAAIGKAAAFAAAVGVWLLDGVALRGVLLFTGDLLFAIFFTWWLFGAEPEAG